MGRGVAEALAEQRRLVAARERDGVLRDSGRVLVAAELARQYGFVDVDGGLPRALTKDEA